MTDVQEIVFIKNLHFKDNNKLDTRKRGHPVLIIHTTDEYIYFLKISTHPPKSETEEEQYFFEGLGYINLKYIYKKERLGYLYYTYLSDEEFNNVMDIFYYYQNFINQDSLFNEMFQEQITLSRNKSQEKTKKF